MTGPGEAKRRSDTSSGRESPGRDISSSRRPGQDRWIRGGFPPDPDFASVARGMRRAGRPQMAPHAGVGEPPYPPRRP
jgi:hypothetical protein